MASEFGLQNGAAQAHYGFGLGAFVVIPDRAVIGVRRGQGEERDSGAGLVPVDFGFGGAAVEGDLDGVGIEAGLSVDFGDGGVAGGGGDGLRSGQAAGGEGEEKESHAVQDYLMTSLTA